MYKTETDKPRANCYILALPLTVFRAEKKKRLFTYSVIYEFNINVLARPRAAMHDANRINVTFDNRYSDVRRPSRCLLLVSRGIELLTLAARIVARVFSARAISALTGQQFSSVPRKRVGRRLGQKSPVNYTLIAHQLHRNQINRPDN